MNLFKKKQPDIPRRRMIEGAVNNNQTSSFSDVFKRGRTLVGSFSRQIDSSRTQVHHLSLRRRKLSGILTIVAAITAFLWLIVGNFTASVTISTYDAKIIKTVTDSIYEKAIQDYMNDNPLSRFIFMLDEDALSGYIASRLPEVVKLKVQNDSFIRKPGEVNFALTLRSPVAGWKITDKKYYVDASGVSFERNYYTEPTVQIVDNSGIKPTAGAAVASRRFLGFVGRVVTLSKSNGCTVTEAILPANTTRELDIKLKEISSYIKFSIDRTAGEQAEDMGRAVKYFISAGQTPNYIDVRVSGKAFYKF